MLCDIIPLQQSFCRTELWSSCGHILAVPQGELGDAWREVGQMSSLDGTHYVTLKLRPTIHPQKVRPRRRQKTCRVSRKS
jgi:hypothetical protein